MRRVTPGVGPSFLCKAHPEVFCVATDARSGGIINCYKCTRGVYLAKKGLSAKLLPGQQTTGKKIGKIAVERTTAIEDKMKAVTARRSAIIDLFTSFREKKLKLSSSKPTIIALLNLPVL